VVAQFENACVFVIESSFMALAVNVRAADRCILQPEMECTKGCSWRLSKGIQGTGSE